MIDKIQPKSLTKKSKAHINTGTHRRPKGKTVISSLKIPIWIIERDKKTTEIYSSNINGYLKGFIYAFYQDITGRITNISVCSGFEGKNPKPINKLVFNLGYKAIQKTHIPDKFTEAVILFNEGNVIGIYPSNLSEKWNMGFNILDEIENSI